MTEPVVIPQIDPADPLALDVAAIGRIGAVPSILEVVCKATGLRFAAVARVTKDRWVACATRDEIEFGLKAGGELKVETTICDQIRDDCTAVVIDEVRSDPLYHDHHTPKMYGFQSYISMPITRSSGEFFGTLCALDPLPAQLSDAKTVKTFELFAQLISLQLDAEERLQRSQMALLNEKQTAELREQFIAVLGHDLRNPLFSVMAGSYALLKMQISEDARATVERIQRSGNRMIGLVEHILDFARGRLGGGLPIKRQPTGELEQVLAQVVAELASLHPECKVQFRTDMAGPVSCDPGRIGQLLSNLLGNAMSHGDASGPVTVDARSQDGIFTLAVSNAGEPIPAATRQRLFQPFSRPAANRQHEGLGLGLYIASQIAQAHGGTLEVESHSGRTTFTLSMPAAA